MQSIATRLLPMLIAALLGAQPAIAIGNRTHVTIGDRAVTHYLQGAETMLPGLQTLFLNLENRYALYSGCTFPDWGYSGIHHDAGEQAHWTPFHEAHLQELRARFEEPWTRENEKDAAFFFGGLCHSVADIPWHFGGPKGKSFIEAATAAEGSDHNTCDTGSDVFTCAYAENMPEIPFGEFYWPKDLLHAVYLRAGLRLSTELIRTGGVRQQGLLLTVPQFAAFKRAEYDSRAPWVRDHMHSYYHGGLEHNAAATAMWIKHYYARLKGWYYFQNLPEYGTRPPNWLHYQGTQDLTISPGAATPNRDGSVLQLAAAPGTQTFLRFDLGEIPPATRIRKAVLWLAVAETAATEANPTRIEARTCTKPWVDADDPASTAPDGSADLLATAELTSAAMPGPWFPLEITAAAQRWLDDPAANHGLHLVASGPPLAVHASEAWKTGDGPYCGGTHIQYRPTLIIFPQE